MGMVLAFWCILTFWVINYGGCGWGVYHFIYHIDEENKLFIRREKNGLDN
jgi:hypothetical protein